MRDFTQWNLEIFPYSFLLEPTMSCIQFEKYITFNVIEKIII